jgi:hypothetical protein
MSYITINIAEGAIQINQNTETILEMKVALQNIVGMLTDITKNDPAKIQEIADRAAAQIERLNAVVENNPAPEGE